MCPLQPLQRLGGLPGSRGGLAAPPGIFDQRLPHFGAGAGPARFRPGMGIG